VGEARHFAICIHNGEYAGTLELRKVYEELEDTSAAARDYARIIDESCEDYLCPKSWFVSAVVPESVEELLHDLMIK
jgi:hypothetical protein